MILLEGNTFKQNKQKHKKRYKMKTNEIYEKAKRGEYIDRKDISNLIRAALKAKFKGVKFSVSTHNNCINVVWVDGPNSDQVESVISQYETQNFDSMIDLAHSRSLWLAPDGTASVLHDCGTEGSMGLHREIIGSAHHPDAVMCEKIVCVYVRASHRITASRLVKAVEEVKSGNYSDLNGYDWSDLQIEPNPYGAYFKRVGSEPQVGGYWLTQFIMKIAYSYSSV